jgi:hypothetical protein
MHHHAKGPRGGDPRKPFQNLPALDDRGAASSKTKSPQTQRADKVAAQLGVSCRHYEKAKAVVAAAEAEPEKYGKLLADMDRTGHVEPEVITIVVHPVADKPGYFEARLVDGDRVFAPSRTPFCDAARQLLDLGCDRAAVLVMKHAGSAAKSLRAPIGVAAPLTVEESAFGPVFRRRRNGSPSAVEAPGIRSGDRAGTQEPGRTVGGATAPVGTDIAIEATTELAGANIVEQSAHAFDRHRTSPPSAVQAPGMRSGSRAGTQDPSRTVGGATGNAGTDIASLLAVRLDSPTEATTELAGDDPLAIPDFLRRAPL